MNKAIATLSAVLIAATTLVSGGAASAAPNQEASGVSAYYRADLGYKVAWQTPSDKTGITGYVVTANSGQTCAVVGGLSNTCAFKATQLGYSGSFNFTVSTKSGAATLAVSSVSNTVGPTTIPTAPILLTSEAASSTIINVAWIPSPGTGNLDLYGYKVTYWKSDLVGTPVNATKVVKVVSGTSTSLSVSPKTMYIIDVAACNALGCNSTNYWSYVATDPASAEVKAVKLPTIISGGSASTTCFDSIYDANTGESATGNCGSVVANPSTYPVINSSATELVLPNLATKLANQAVLSNFLKSYSLRTWAPIGIPWFANLTSTSKSPTLGFTTTATVSSSTPAICSVVGEKIMLTAIGTCKLAGYVDGNSVFKPSNTASASFTVTN
jgi:hypothetical protein